MAEKNVTEFLEDFAPPNNFHRKRSRLKQMFLASIHNFLGQNINALQSDTSDQKSINDRVHGLFLVLDHRGRRVHSRCMTVQYWREVEGSISFTLANSSLSAGNTLQYLWSARGGRWKRIKSSPAPLNQCDVQGKRGQKNLAQPSSKGQRPGLVLRWSKTGREGYRSDEKTRNKFDHRVEPEKEDKLEKSDDYSEDDESYEPKGYEDDHPKIKPYVKAVNNSCKSYLLGRGVAQRNSKMRRREMETLRYITSTSDTYDVDVRDDDDEEACQDQPTKPSPLTFGDYCCSPAASKDYHTRISIPEAPNANTESGSQIDGASGRNYVITRLLRSETRPDVLMREFKRDFREAPCKPRRFVLNITHLLQHHVILMSRLRVKHIPRLDLSTYLVFTFRRCLDFDLDEYRVIINSTWCTAPTGSVFGVTDQKYVPIQELLRRTIHAFRESDFENLKVKAKDPRPQKLQYPVCLFNQLRHVAPCESGSVCLPLATEWLAENAAVTQPLDTDSNSVLNNVMRRIFEHEWENNKSADLSLGPSISNMCGLCFASFDITDEELSPSIPLALSSCSHWFCEQCWTSRVLIRLRNGHRPCKVPCPEKDCPNALDPVTLLSILSVQEIRRMRMFRIQDYVMTSKELKFCPNSLCRCLVWASNSSSITSSTILTCACGYQFCFSCLCMPHWPSPCGTADSYNRMVSSSGGSSDVLDRLLAEREFPEVVMRGKKCPRCALFIQQSGSSKICVCPCGCQFCWPCGKEMKPEEVHAFCIETFERSDKVLKDIVNNGQTNELSCKISRWHGTALVHRKMRNSEVVLALYTMAESLAENISAFVDSGRYVGDLDAASEGWDKQLLTWAHKNFETILLSTNSQSEHELLNVNKNGTRPISAKSVSSLSLKSTNANLVDSPISRATANIVQTKLEMHYIVEYTSVLLATTIPPPTKLAQCVERAEDLCTACGILLQKTPRNSRHTFPAFLRLRENIRQVVGQIFSIVEKIPFGVFAVYDQEDKPDLNNC